MLLRLMALLSFGLALILSSCAPEHSQIVLAEFGNQKVKMDQFEKAYAKNVGGMENAKNDSLSQFKNFLNLYVDFRMKLRDAYVRGFDQDPKLKKELTDYEKKVGSTYLLNKYVITPGIDTLYNRRKWELRISHIMIRPDSIGEAAAKKKAEAILDSVLHGANFAALARKYSQDKYSRRLGGDVYYITGGMLPPNFEDAAYATKVGQVYPHVIKSPYGFHVLKVTEKRKRVPEIRVSQIMASLFNSKSRRIDTVDAKAKIDTVLKKIKEGENFAKLAKKYSDDPRSAKKGGDIGFFRRRTLPKPFDEAAFNLKKVGDISGIVRTQYGYHIIKLTAKEPYPDLKDDKKNLEQIFKKYRYKPAYDSLIEKYRKEYHYKLNDQTFGNMIGRADTAKIGSDSHALDKIKDLVLFTYDNKKVNVGEFLKKLNADNDFSAKPMNANTLQKAVKKISGKYLLDEAALNLENTDPQFAALMKNYKEGIYIFKLQEDEVWNKIKIDSTKLYQYYLKTKDNYKWPDRVSFGEIFVRNDSTAKALYKKLKNGANFDTLAKKYTQRPGYNKLSGKHALEAVTTSDLSEKAYKLNHQGELTKPFRTRGGFSIIKLISKDPSHLKTFAEAKPEASGAYQDMESKELENDYINRLKKIYKPEIFYSKLEEAYKNEK